MTTTPAEHTRGARSGSQPPATAGATCSGRAATAGQLGWYTAIGIASTLAYLALYQLLREPLGAQPANLLAWVLTAMVDTAANRRYTFGLAGRAGAARAQVEGLAVFGLGYVLTSGSLAALDAVSTDAGRTAELGVLAAANLAAGLLRFLLLRVWVFAPHRTTRPRCA
jgi:putative flippase GtrA